MVARPQPGDVLGGKYILRERIGEGGMGTVFVADQPILGRKVAIKVLHPDLCTSEQLAHRFRDEAIAASRVRHPGSVVVLDCNLAEPMPYIVMEHIPGRPLGRVIAEQTIPAPRAIAIVQQILGAVDAAHCAGVVHNDLKSDNFMVEEVDGTDHVTMIDFGLARVAGRAPTHDDLEDRMISGTPEYMAPEVIRGETSTTASDLYAVGVILYELLTGATPFAGGRTTEIMQRHLDDLVVPPSVRRPERNIPPALDAIVLRALEKQPHDRFADATEFANALRAAVLATHNFGGAPVRHDDHSHPDSPTRVCGPRLPRGRFARGSGCNEAIGETDATVDLRAAIGYALVRGDLRRIADGYTRLATALVHDHRVADAVYELEEGIDILTAGAGISDPDAPKVVDQLVVALAALYDQAGDRQLAREVAANADLRPTLTSVR